MAVDKAPGKKDKLTDAEKKKQKQANKVRSIFCPLNFTCFFFSSSRRPKDLFFSLLDYFLSARTMISSLWPPSPRSQAKANPGKAEEKKAKNDAKREGRKESGSQKVINR